MNYTKYKTWWKTSWPFCFCVLKLLKLYYQIEPANVSIQFLKSMYSSTIIPRYLHVHPKWMRIVTHILSLVYAVWHYIVYRLYKCENQNLNNIQGVLYYDHCILDFVKGHYNASDKCRVNANAHLLQKRRK